MGRVCFIGTLVEVSAEWRLKRFNAKNLGGDFNRHCPVDGIVLNAWRCSRTLDFCDIFEWKSLSVIAVFSTGGKHESSACRFEVEIFGRVCWVLQKDFYAGIFPTASVVFLNSGAVAVHGLFDCELDDDAGWCLCEFSSDHRVDDSLIGRPFHIRF